MESNPSRKSRTVEHRGDGDKSKLLKNSTNRTQSIRSTSKPSTGSSQVKTVKQSSSSTLKSSPHNASSSHLLKKSTNSKTKSENAIKLSDDSTVKKRKSREQTGYSEKRGLSTVYMPKPIASKLKSNEKTVHRTSRDKEKLQDSSDQVKPQLSTKERRQSRTLSPSEIRMLHSAAKKPEKAEKIDQKKNITTDASNYSAQADSDQADYDYEDDFEVKKYKKKKRIVYKNYITLIIF